MFQHCGYPDCTADLLNARGGVYCAFHENLVGRLCHVGDCNNVKVQGTQACAQHQGRWQRHDINHRTNVLGGYRRAMRRADETMPWMPAASTHRQQPHDTDDSPGRAPSELFTPPRSYCVETICAPCGVVIAWAKFTKAESPSNILGFLEHVYPTNEVRPSYICIDKACLVLRTCVTNGTWERWGNTSRFIVDSYHYVNHCATDQLCCKWCNPAPLDGSAPNLVLVETDERGRPYFKRAFNTQACEQLNAWLGGFDNIMRRMTSWNFDWFLQSMLFYHTKQVMKRQEKKRSSEKDNESEDEDEDVDEV